MSTIETAIELTKEFTKDYKIVRVETAEDYFLYLRKVTPPWMFSDTIEDFYCFPKDYSGEFLSSLKDPSHPHKYRYKIYNEGIVDKTWCFTKSGKKFFCVAAANMHTNEIILINEVLGKCNLDLVLYAILHEVCHLKYRTLDENFCDIYAVEKRNLIKASITLKEI